MTGGIGGMRDTCGGLLGAAMMLGSVCGRDRSDMDKKDRLNDTVFRTGKLYKWYEQKYGSTRCYDIKKFFGNGVYYDTNVPWQAEMAKQAGIPGKCSALVEETAEYAIEELWNIMGRQK